MSDPWSADALPAETPAEPLATAAAAPAASVARRSRWPRRLILGAGALVGALLMYLLLAAFLPRWWAQQTADVVSGRFTVGTFFGLFLGFAFTILPLVAVVFAVRRRRTRWRIRFVLLGVALVLAAPNLLTLSVVLGRGNAAHAGERIMDVEAPAFRGASLAGALIAIVVLALTLMLLASRRRNKRRLGSLRDELRRHNAEPDEEHADGLNTRPA